MATNKKKNNNNTANITAKTDIFDGTRSITDLTSYMLMRGVTDFGDLTQFNLYEAGYSFFVVMRIPEFLRRLAKYEEYKKLINNYAHILEFENRGISGIDNITTENGQLTNGINQVNIINKVNKPSDSTFTASYQEKLGSTITKAHELYITGIKDPRTQVKTYHGLISDTDGLAAGYQNEVFRFMYIVCDNTLTNLERAVCIASAQINSVPLDIYNSEKGNYEFKEISVEFNGFPIWGRQVNALANEFRKKIFDNTVWSEYDKVYSQLGGESIDNNDASIRGTSSSLDTVDYTMYNTMNSDEEISFNYTKVTGDFSTKKNTSTTKKK